MHPVRRGPREGGERLALHRIDHEALSQAVPVVPHRVDPQAGHCAPQADARSLHPGPAIGGLATRPGLPDDSPVRGDPKEGGIDQSEGLTRGRILRTWWPLAVSWLLMGLEGPLLSLVVARLADPEIQLAAYGGVVFPLAMFIEAPIVMLLSASTALSKDWPSYRRIRRFMHITSAALTAVHALVVLTPLYHVVVGGLLGMPEEVLGPARLGLTIVLPWTWSIAYRRFNQGVLIRFGHSLTVGVGTGIRLLSNGTVLLIGYLLGSLPGIVVATSAIAAGVVSEAIYVAIRVRPVLRRQVRPALEESPLSFRSFLGFYVPLSLTSVILLGIRPLISAGLSRMPLAIESLALWSVVGGLIFLLRSVSVASNEVVIALLGTPHAASRLRRFTLGLAATTSTLLLLITVTGLSRVWFGTVTGLSPDLIRLARNSLWFALPLPAMSALQSWYQGVVLHGKKTRSVTEAVLMYLGVSALVLGVGIVWGGVPGLYVGLLSMSLAEAARTVWLGWRSRAARRALLDEVAAVETP